MNYAIVDEVDSILIDEARTPLIISGRSEESTELYVRINQLIPSLKIHKPPPGKANDEIESTQVELLGVTGNSLGADVDRRGARESEGGRPPPDRDRHRQRSRRRRSCSFPATTRSTRSRSRRT